jgi:hypothetical protein
VEYPHLGTPDSTADVRGGMGTAGLAALHEFVNDGGTLIVEGGTAVHFPQHHLLPGVQVETPRGLFARGTILRGIIADSTSPLVYGFDTNQLPIYFSQGPILNASDLPAVTLPEAEIDRRGTSAGRYGGTLLNPNARPLELSPWVDGERYVRADTAARRAVARVGLPTLRPRVVMQFPSAAEDMLLSGGLAGGSLLANRALLIDSPVGRGHVVSFAMRPFWRWQTQGTYILGFPTVPPRPAHPPGGPFRCRRAAPRHAPPRGQPCGRWRRRPRALTCRLPWPPARRPPRRGCQPRCRLR